jgi:hypothetical protein
MPGSRRQFGLPTGCVEFEYRVAEHESEDEPRSKSLPQQDSSRASKLLGLLLRGLAFARGAITESWPLSQQLRDWRNGREMVGRHRCL